MVGMVMANTLILLGATSLIMMALLAEQKCTLKQVVGIKVAEKVCSLFISLAHSKALHITLQSH